MLPPFITAYGTDPVSYRCVLRTYHFPDAFYGQNNKIRETLNNLILKSPQDWQTAVALPFVRIQGTTVEWDELRCKQLATPLLHSLLTSLCIN